MKWFVSKATRKGLASCAACVFALSIAGPATAATLAWAGAESGFNGRTIDVYSAEQTNGSMTAQASIGEASIFGHTITDKIPSYARSRADFTVHGITANTLLTFNFEVQGYYQWSGADTSGVGLNSGSWTAFVEAGLPHPGGGGYSMFGNLRVRAIGGELGDTSTIVQCNGNTRGQDFCSVRRDFSEPQLLSVSGLASEGTAGFVTEELNAAGLNADMFVSANLVSVTVADAIFFAGSPVPAVSARSAFAFNAVQNNAYLEWEDGSRFEITLANSGNDVPEPGSLALMAVGLLGCVRRWHGKRRSESLPA